MIAKCQKTSKGIYLSCKNQNDNKNDTRNEIDLD